MSLFGKKEEKQVSICPKCGSTNIGTNSGNIASRTVFPFGAMPRIDRKVCDNCGYGKNPLHNETVNFPMVKVLDVDKFREDLKKNRK